MRALAAAFALLALLAQEADAAAGRVVTLALPRVAAGESVVLRVRAGVLERGREIDVYGDGKLLGTVSPFAVRGHGEAGSYTIPLRGRMGLLRVRLVLTEPSRPDRAPTAQELRGVTLTVLKGS